MKKQYVFRFEEGNGKMRELLGGKNQQELALPLDSLTITEPAGTATYTLDVEEDLLAQTWEARYTSLVKDGAMTLEQFTDWMIQQERLIQEICGE